MSFLSPLFLAGAAAAIVPIVLHLFRRRTEQRVRFAAVALLKGAPVEQRSRRRLRELLLLGLRVTALVLFALAFARPFFRRADASGRRLTVVAIDTSLSMSAPSTFARARQLARDVLTQASAEDVALIAFSDRADVVVPPTSDHRAVTTAVDMLQAGFGSTSYSAGLSAAGELFGGRSGTITVVTDLQASGWDAGSRGSVPPSVRVDVRDVGAAGDDVAVESVRAEDGRVIASIRNAGARARDVRVSLAIDRRPAAQTVMNVAARSAGEAVFQGVRASGVAAVSVDDPGGIAGDDIRYAITGSDAPAAALVVTSSGDLDKDAWYVRHALAGVRGVSTTTLGTWKRADLERYGAVVLLSTRGLERSARTLLAEYVNAGGGLLIAAGQDVDEDVVADVLGTGAALKVRPGESRASEAKAEAALHFTPVDVRHPIFRAFGTDVGSLGLVGFHEIARVGGRTCQAIAQFTSGASAVLDCAAGAGRAIVVASDLDNRWNDWPTHASYVPFLDQATRYLAGSARRSAEYLVGDVPPGVAPRPGVATIRTETGERRAVVNVDPREIASERMTPADFQASISHLESVASERVHASVADDERRQHLWRYLIAAMILVLLAESVVAARTA
jgi:hypothetical protein